MTCINPKCSGTPIKRPEHSTAVADVYFCPTCGCQFPIQTRAGIVRDFAPAVIATVGLLGFLGFESDHDFGSSFGGDDF
jgi:hypothetical protein